MTRLDLIGDSHLEYLPPGLASSLIPAGKVICCAVGGSTIVNVPSQIRQGADVYLLSVGTNDAGSWAGPALGRFVDHLTALVASLSAPLAYLRPPGIWAPSMGAFGEQVVENIERFACAATTVVEDAGGLVIDVRPDLEPLGARAFAWDGVHLSLDGYQAIVSRLAAGTQTLS